VFTTWGIYPLLVIVGCLIVAYDSSAQESGAIAAPVFSHHGGQYTVPFHLQINADAGATVRYTTDGSMPCDITSYEYTEPLLIDSTTIIRARTSDGAGMSSVVSALFTLLDDTTKHFNSNLPLVIVHQFDSNIRSGGRIPAYISIVDLNQSGRASLADPVALQSRIQSNVRGSSSQRFPKKQYAVRLVDESDENRNEPVLGMPPENNWILHAPYDDKSLIRNALAYRVSRDVGRYSPRTRFVEVFLHEGHGPVTMEQYHGVYMLVERIKWDNNRVNISKLSPDDRTEPKITGGYIFQNDRENHIRTARGSGFALVRPQNEDINDEQRAWLVGWLDAFEAALFGDSFTDPDSGYTAYIDQYSFIDHHLMTELFKEIDGYRLSTFMYKDRGGKLVMGPLWDFNLSMGNVHGQFPQAGRPVGWYYTQIRPMDYLYGWYTRLFQDPLFGERYRDRWRELRRGPFSNDHLTGLIRKYVDLLDEAQQRNFIRWPILGESVWPHPSGSTDRLTYADEVNWMMEWLEARLEWIDLQLGAPSALELVHYWYFNRRIQNDTPLIAVDGTYSDVGGGRMEFHSALEGYPFHPGHAMWRKASLERRNMPTFLNYLPEANNGAEYDDEDMRGIQIRQPFAGDGGENTLILHVPTSRREGIVLRFAAMDEGAVDSLLIDYSTTGTMDEWSTAGLSTERFPLETEYRVYEADFTDIPEADDNPFFRIRIRFRSENPDADSGNRVAFNNISVESRSITVGFEEPQPPSAAEFRLGQNYPNPFNPATVIRFSIPSTGHTKLTVYNALGQAIQTLVDENLPAGDHEAHFSASHLPSGIYFYRLRTGAYVRTKKMLLLK
jgi:hypothetical protein